MLFAETLLGSSIYYRDKEDTYDTLNMGGSFRLKVTQAMLDTGTSFELITIRIDGTDNVGTIVPNGNLPKLRIEKFVYSLS